MTSIYYAPNFERVEGTVDSSTVRAPVFGRHQFFGTSEHYGKAHGSLLSGWMNYNYTACCWFPTSNNILILPSLFWQIRFESYWFTVQSAEYWCSYGKNNSSLITRTVEESQQSTVAGKALRRAWRVPVQLDARCNRGGHHRSGKKWF